MGHLKARNGSNTADWHPSFLSSRMSSLRKDGLLPARAGLWNEIHSTSPLHAPLTDNGGTLKAAVQLGGFLPLQHHLNGPALFLLLIVMKAFHYAGSFMANKQLWIQYRKCKLKYVFGTCVRKLQWAGRKLSLGIDTHIEMCPYQVLGEFIETLRKSIRLSDSN